MNYLDELLAVYPERDRAARRFLLASVGGHPLGLETDALLEFLWGQTAATEAPLRHLARRQLGRMMPLCLRQAHGLEAARIGVWSSWASGETPAQPDADAHLMAAGWQPLAGLLERALALLSTGSPRVRLAASLVAGRVQTASVVQALGAEPLSFLSAAALADLGSAATRDRLVREVEKTGAAASDLVMLVGDAERAVAVLAPLARSSDELVRSNVALALASDAGPAAHAVLAQLAAGRSGWVTAFALEALAAHPQAPDLAIAQSTFAAARAEFIRIQAVKLAGAVGGDEGTDWLEDVLARGAPRVRAAALEALARSRADPARLARKAARELDQPLLKLKVNAMLVLAKTDLPRVQEALTELLGSDDVVARVEAAYVLGYLRAPASADLLGQLACGDPSVPVRVQAIKSLAKQAADSALPHLLAAADTDSPRAVGLAARALAAFPEDALPGAVEALAGAARAARSPVHRGLILRAYGIAVSRRAIAAPAPDLLIAALSDPSEPVMLGALEGLKCVGGAPLDPVVRLAASPDARVRHRASVAAFLEGHLEAAASIDDLLASADEARVLSGLQAFLEIAILMPVALSAPQFAPLRATRGRLAEKKSVVEFVQRETPRAAPEQPPRRDRPTVVAARFEPVAVPLALARPAPKRAPAQDVKLVRRQVEAAGYLSGFPVSSFAEYRPLFAAAVMLVVPLAVIGSQWRSASTAVERPRRRLEPGMLKVVEVRGSAERGAPGRPTRPVQANAVIRAGERIVTGPSSGLEVTDGDGNAIRLGRSSAALLALPPAPAPQGTAYVVKDATGTVEVDFQHDGYLDLDLGTARLIGRGVLVKLREGALELAAGEADLTVAGQEPRRVRGPHTVAIPRR